MANTSPVHKAKKSQKRKDRQERRRERDLKRKRENLKIEDNEQEISKNGISRRENPGKNPLEQKRRKKSLPGYLAKNSDQICRWLRNYLYLFIKVDDAQIGFLDGIPRERRNELVQEYVDVMEFVENVQKLRMGQVEIQEEITVSNGNEEIPENRHHE